MRVDARGIALVVVAVSTLQVGAAFAVTLFDEVGPAGAALLRLGIAALVLLAVWRPSLAGHSRADVLTAVAFGLALGTMNWAIYSAMDRIPIGVAVTIEFAGPLGLAVALSRRPRDLVWVALAAAGILLLTNPFGASDLDGAGIALALIAAAAWAVYIPLSARTGTLFPGGRGLAIAMLAGALLVAPGRDRAGRGGAAGARAARPGRDRRARLLRDPVLARARVAAADPGARVRGADVARAGRRRARRVRRPRPGARRRRPRRRSASSSSRARERRWWGRKTTDAT